METNKVMGLLLLTVVLSVLITVFFTKPYYNDEDYITKESCQEQMIAVEDNAVQVLSSQCFGLVEQVCGVQINGADIK